MMSGLDGSSAVHKVLPWEAFGGHVPSGGSEMYWFDESIPIHLVLSVVAPGKVTCGRCRARRVHLARFHGLPSKDGSSQGQNLALTVLCVPSSLDSGWAAGGQRASVFVP